MGTRVSSSGFRVFGEGGQAKRLIFYERSPRPPPLLFYTCALIIPLIYVSSTDTNSFLSQFPIHLVTLFSSKYFPRSASFMSSSLFSNTPLNGIRMAPGSFLSTHSLILINLKIVITVNHRTRDKLDINRRSNDTNDNI